MLVVIPVESSSCEGGEIWNYHWQKSNQAMFDDMIPV